MKRTLFPVVVFRVCRESRTVQTVSDCNLCDSKLLASQTSSSFSATFPFFFFFAVWTKAAGIVCGGVMRERESGSARREGGGCGGAESHYTVQEVVKLCVCVCIWT